MPPRLVSVAILLYWVVAASSLIRRDILPEISFARPPDLRSITHAGDVTAPVRWSVEVIDNPLAPENRRPIGDAVTRSESRPDGSTALSSVVQFDTGQLLKGTAFAEKAEARLKVRSTFQVDPSGNLVSFRATVTSPPDPKELVKVVGQRKGRVLEIASHGLLPMMTQKRTLPYEPRSLVQNALGPFDRLPGLQVGQRWESRMVSPLTGRVETVLVEVTGKTTIHWDREPVPVLVVVHHIAPLSAKTWVRRDGLVLRQEVPFPFVKLILERQPERATVPSVEATAR